MKFVAREDFHNITVPESALGALVMSSDELAFFANVIVQARIAIDDWEFSSLVGLEPEQAEALRDVVIDALREHHRPQT